MHAFVQLRYQTHSTNKTFHQSLFPKTPRHAKNHSPVLGRERKSLHPPKRDEMHFFGAESLGAKEDSPIEPRAPARNEGRFKIRRGNIGREKGVA